MAGLTLRLRDVAGRVQIVPPGDKAPFTRLALALSHSQPEEEGAGPVGPLLRLGNPGSPQVPHLKLGLKSTLGVHAQDLQEALCFSLGSLSHQQWKKPPLTLAPVLASLEEPTQ